MFGKPVADGIERRVRDEVKTLSARGIVPRLDVVLVGKSAASQRYVGKKMGFCERLGMQARLHTFDDHVSAGELRDQVRRINDDPAVHAILVQLPLPRHIE
ncbi:MAG: tetrahydrofolate dehydrogenase/cyclohydrolase catalytic domain-containing protein, partial [Candidatus Angelobacter sp.]